MRNTLGGRRGGVASVVEKADCSAADAGAPLEAIRAAYWGHGLVPDDVETLMRSVESRLQLTTGRVRRVNRLAPFAVGLCALLMLGALAIITLRGAAADATTVWLLSSAIVVALALTIGGIWASVWSKPPSMMLELPEDIRIMRKALSALDPGDRSRLLAAVRPDAFPHLSTMNLAGHAMAESPPNKRIEPTPRALD